MSHSLFSLFPNITMNFWQNIASDLALCVTVNVTAHICFIGSLHTPDKREVTLTTHTLKCGIVKTYKFIISVPYKFFSNFVIHKQQH